jgi:hypothetical protein
MPLTTVSVSLRRVIGLSQWFIMPCLWLLYQYHEEEWYVYHSNLSRYVWLLHQYHEEELYIYSSDLWCYISDYCISITKKSDKSITLSYHAMSLTTVSVSQRSVIGLSLSCHAMSLTTVSVSQRSVIGLSVIYHDRSLTTVSVSRRRVIRLSHWFITLCPWLLYQYN